LIIIIMIDAIYLYAWIMLGSPPRSTLSLTSAGLLPVGPAVVPPFWAKPPVK